jgi:hypothetical protein
MIKNSCLIECDFLIGQIESSFINILADPHPYGLGNVSTIPKDFLFLENVPNDDICFNAKCGILFGIDAEDNTPCAVYVKPYNGPFAKWSLKDNEKTAISLRSNPFGTSIRDIQNNKNFLLYLGLKENPKYSKINDIELLCDESIDLLGQNLINNGYDLGYKLRSKLEKGQLYQTNLIGKFVSYQNDDFEYTFMTFISELDPRYMNPNSPPVFWRVDD